MTRTLVTTVACLTVCLGTVSPASAQDVFLLVPNIPGESVVRGYENWIAAWSMSQSATGEKGGGCAVHVAKPLDKAGPLLWAATVTGQALGEVKLHVVVPSGEGAPRLLYELLLANARITSISTSASAGGGAVEQASIGAGSATLRYFPGTGQPVSSTITCTK